MKRVFIVHGWGGKPDEHWLPWLRDELTTRGFEVFIPRMPNADEPIIGAWVTHLAELVGELDAQTYFVGHSVGCQAIMRYLATQQGKRAGGCVFVAGWFKLDGLEEEGDEVVRLSEPWLTQPIDFDAVRAVTPKIDVLLSSNDDYGYVEENEEMFKEDLKATVTVLPDRGHFTGADGVTELPEALAAVEDLSK